MITWLSCPWSLILGSFSVLIYSRQCLQWFDTVVGHQEEHLACKKLTDKVLVWLSAALKSGLVLPFWYGPIQVILEKRPLSRCNVLVVVYHGQTNIFLINGDGMPEVFEWIYCCQLVWLRGLSVRGWMCRTGRWPCGTCTPRPTSACVACLSDTVLPSTSSTLIGATSCQHRATGPSRSVSSV